MMWLALFSCVFCFRCCCCYVVVVVAALVAHTHVENCEEWDIRLGCEVSEVCVNDTWTAIHPDSSSGITSVMCKQLDSSMYGT